jgi:hypothetical protein
VRLHRLSSQDRLVLLLGSTSICNHAESDGQRSPHALLVPTATPIPASSIQPWWKLQHNVALITRRPLACEFRTKYIYYILTIKEFAGNLSTSMQYITGTTVVCIEHLLEQFFLDYI